MRIIKGERKLTLAHLNKGDLFEKDCNNPCMTYMVVEGDDGSRNFCCEVIKDSDKHGIVVDLKNAIVKALPLKTAVTPLEQIDALEVEDKI